MRVLIDLFFVSLLAYVLYDGITRYRAASGSFWDRMIAVGKGTSTILVQRGVYLLSALMELLPQLLDLVGAPNVSASIQSILPSGGAPYYALGFAFLSELARHRTLPPG